MRGLRRSAFLIGIAGVGLSVIGLPGGAYASVPRERVIVNLGTLPGGKISEASSVNERGFIVGAADTAKGDFHAVRWNPDGHIIDLGVLPGGTYSYAEAINERGDIVGYSSVAGGEERAVRWAPDGAITELAGLPGHTAANAYGINDRGTVVGSAVIKSKVYRAVKWQPDGTVSDIGANSPLESTHPAAINNRGVVAGAAYEVSPGHYSQALTWTAAGTATVLPALPGGATRTNAQGINNRGLIVGYSQSGPGEPPNFPVHAVLWSPGASAPTDLGTLPGGSDRSAANGVNDAGVIVGHSWTSATGHRDAVLWQRNKDGWRIVPLPGLPGGPQAAASAISDNGEIVGQALTASGQNVAVRWK